jgi:hypothetical protein
MRNFFRKLLYPFAIISFVLGLGFSLLGVLLLDVTENIMDKK